MRRLRPQAKARPGALPVPANRDVCALAKPNVLDKWGEEAAGVRPAALAIGDNVITMFDIIGEDFWTGGGITAKKVASQLRAIGDKPVEVQINSPGGDVFEGIAIYNVLREHPQPITVKVMGMAASIASVIAMAGDTVEIGAASFIMIHNSWVMAIGDRHAMAEVAAWLEPFDQALRDVYALRSGQKPDAIAKWMDEETFMSGAQAIERGFADNLLPADQVKVEEKTQAADRQVNKLRALELSLVAAGHTRSDARSKINEIKGTATPGAGAANEARTPGAADPQLVGALAGLLETFRSKE